MNLSYRLFVCYLMVCLMLGSCARNPVTGKKELMLMTESQEIALGQQSDPAIVAQFGLYEDEAMQKFINEKGKAMGEISHRPDLNYTFRILDSPVVNAFALPGGYVYFTRGIMAHFNNEAEFAGVLGHEIGHITARHSAKQYSAQVVGQLGLMAGIIASEDFRQFANEASQALGLLFLKFGRDHESQSDELGVNYSTAIGYNAHEMADFFQTLNRLQEQAGASIPTFLSTHPNPEDRYEKVHELSDKAQAKLDKNALKVNRDAYLQMIDGIIYGDDPRQGYTDGNHFYHPELKFHFSFPKDWTLYNSPLQVQIAPADGKALIILSLSQQPSLEESASADKEQYKLVTIDSRKTRINGYPTLITLSDIIPDESAGADPAGAIRLLSYYIQDGELIYVFRGLAKKTDFNNYNNVLKNALESFSPLTDPARINVKPTRLTIKKLNQGGTLEQVLLRLGVEKESHEELAIVNGMELGDQVQAGQFIKITTKNDQP